MTLQQFFLVLLFVARSNGLLPAQNTAPPAPAWLAMAYLPSGTFFMGDSLGDADEKPVKQVDIPAFWISKCEIKVVDFQRFVSQTAYLTQAERTGGSYAWDSTGWNQNEAAHWRCDERGKLLADSQNLRAVTHVSWVDAAYFCNWLSHTQGLSICYAFMGDSVQILPEGKGYRLPTEAEWEYAAAAGFSRKKHRFAGSDQIRAVAWFSQNSKRKVQQTGLKSPNKAGIYDMTGNVWEWCQNEYHEYDMPDNQIDRKKIINVQDPQRAIRGGAANNQPSHCRVSNRSSRYPDYRDAYTGFRVLLPAKGKGP